MPVSKDFDQLIEDLILFTDDCFKWQFIEKGSHPPYSDENGRDKSYWWYMINQVKVKFSIENYVCDPNFRLCKPDESEILFNVMRSRLCIYMLQDSMNCKQPYKTEGGSEIFKIYGEIKGVGHILTVDKTKR